MGENRQRRENRYGPFVMAVCVGLGLLTASAAGLFVLPSVAERLSPDGSITAEYRLLMERSQWTFAILLALLAPLALFRRALEGIADWYLHRIPDRIVAGVLALVSGLLTLAVQQGLFQGIPHVTDAVAHLFQAKIFCLGRLYADAPSCHESFSYYYLLITESGRWFSIYPPGHALVLAGFMKAHLLPLMGPTLSAITVLCAYSLAARFFDQPAARLTALFTTLSPMFLLLGGSFMSHVTFQAFWIGSLLCLVRAFDAKRPAGLRFLFSGVCYGAAFLIRPQDAVLVAPLYLAVAIALWRSERAVWMRPAAVWVLGALPAAIVFLAWNAMAYGSPFSPGYAVDQADSITHSYRPSFGLDADFTMRTAAYQFLWTMLRFNQASLGWPLSVVFLAFIFFSRRNRISHLVLLAQIGLVVGFFSLYRYHGVEYEARFYSPVLIPFILLAVQGVRVAHRALIRVGPPWSAAIPVLALALTLHGLLFFWPLHIRPVYGAHYESASPALERSVRAEGISRAVVMVDTSGQGGFEYSSGFMHNTPALDSDVVYARYVEADLPCLEKHFAGRAFFRARVDGDSVSIRPLRPAR